MEKQIGEINAAALGKRHEGPRAVGRSGAPFPGGEHHAKLVAAFSGDLESQASERFKVWESYMQTLQPFVGLGQFAALDIALDGLDLGRLRTFLCTGFFHDFDMLKE